MANRTWGRATAAASVLFLSLGGATWNCGGSSGSGLLPADAGPDGSIGFGTGTPGTGLGGDGSSCHIVGAGCLSNTDCCNAACTGGVCGGDAGTATAPPVSTNPTRACVADGVACTVGFDCCSATCNGGSCAGTAVTTPGVDGGPASSGLACVAPTGSCAMGADCCSGVCEPVTGMAGVIQCRDACRADGLACQTAQDCCSLGCFNGTCSSAKECIIIGDTCTTNADCCSGVCDPTLKQCNVDLANSTCRPTGEDCGKGHNSGCCGATKDDDLCDQDGRCGLPKTACRGQTASCASDGDCCSNHCDKASMTCTVVCTAAAGPCQTGADCCTSSCTNGMCDAPQPTPPQGGGNPAPPGGGGAPDAGGGTAPTGPACSVVGAACTSGAACCSGLCLAGFCDNAIIPR